MKIRDVVGMARKPLNDKDADDSNRTWPDDAIRGYVCAGILHAYRNRPDLFQGGYASPPTMSLTLDSDFPMGDTYAELIADYASARCLAEEDENAANGKATQFYALFGKEIPA